jgi:hypothetical protein
LPEFHQHRRLLVRLAGNRLGSRISAERLTEGATSSDGGKVTSPAAGIPVWVVEDEESEVRRPYKVGQQVGLDLTFNGRASAVVGGPETIQVTGDDHLAVTGKVLGTVYEADDPERTGQLITARGLRFAFPDWQLPPGIAEQPEWLRCAGDLFVHGAGPFGKTAAVITGIRLRPRILRATGVGLNLAFVGYGAGQNLDSTELLSTEERADIVLTLTLTT